MILQLSADHSEGVVHDVMVDVNLDIKYAVINSTNHE